MQCFGHFNMLTVHKCSDTRLFAEFKAPCFLQSIVSGRNNFRGSPFSLKYSKFYVGSENAEKNSENIFCF